jgi:hypothetical protein
VCTLMRPRYEERRGLPFGTGMPCREIVTGSLMRAPVGQGCDDVGRLSRKKEHALQPTRLTISYRFGSVFGAVDVCL